MPDDACAACSHDLSDHPPEVGPLGVSFHRCRFAALGICDCPGYTAPGKPGPALPALVEAALVVANGEYRLTAGIGHSQDWANVHPELRAWLEPACAETDCSLTSGHRTYAQQDYLYQGYIARRPGFAPANPAGGSNHEAEPGQDDDATPDAALACDIGGNVSGLSQHPLFLEHGHRPVSGESWHFQDRRTPTGRWTGWGAMGPPTSQPLPLPPVKEPSDMAHRANYNGVAYLFAGTRRRRIRSHGINEALSRATVTLAGTKVDLYPPIELDGAHAVQFDVFDQYVDEDPPSKGVTAEADPICEDCGTMVEVGDEVPAAKRCRAAAAKKGATK